MRTRICFTVCCLLLMSCLASAQIVLSKKDVKCNGDKNGSVTVAGLPNVSMPVQKYEWSNGISGADKKTIDKLGPGTYTVTVTDAHGCTGTGQATVHAPDSKLRLDLSSSADSYFLCGTSSIIVVAQPSGGTPPYTTNGSSGAYAVRVSLASFGKGPKFLDFQSSDNNGCQVKHRQYFAFSAISCASDPNYINGPVGIEEDRWVAAKDRMEYLVKFENTPESATAPAQSVKITVPLDPNLNPFSLQLKDFGWGPYEFHIPDGTVYYQQRLDLRDSLNLYVDVVAGYDINTNAYFWDFESVDPLTGQRPADPQVGFLPINDSLTASGEGFVRFSALPKLTVVTGDTVTVHADITFDINASIPTNTWQNLLDAGPPVSVMSPIPDTVESDSIPLIWTATDDPGGVGVDDYTLFVSVDGGTFTLVQDDIKDSTYLFQGTPGVTYGFVVLATDLVGNREAMKQIAEATTYILPARSISLTHPSGHDLCVMDTLSIRWNKVTTDSVRVEFSVDSGTTYFVLMPETTRDTLERHVGGFNDFGSCVYPVVRRTGHQCRHHLATPDDPSFTCCRCGNG